MTKESFNLRVESGLRDNVARLAELSEGDSRPSDLSRTARKLILIGVAFRRAGLEPQYEGPLGVLPRPFVDVDFGGEKVTFGTQLEEEVVAELTQQFGDKKHTAAREALKLGIIAVQLEDLDITGPFDIPRPFAKIQLEEEIDDTRALALLRNFRTYIQDVA